MDQAEILIQLKEGVLKLAQSQGIAISKVNLDALDIIKSIAVLSATEAIPLKSEVKDLKDLKDVKSKQECCVCFGETTELTECKHPVCTDCLKQLTTLQCPLCRQGLGKINPKVAADISKREANRKRAIGMADRIVSVINAADDRVRSAAEEKAYQALSYVFYTKVIGWLTSALDQRDRLLEYDNKLDQQEIFEEQVFRERAKDITNHLNELLATKMGGVIPADVKGQVDQEIKARLAIIDREDRIWVNQSVRNSLARMMYPPTAQQLNALYEDTLFTALWNRQKRCENPELMC